MHLSPWMSSRLATVMVRWLVSLSLANDPLRPDEDLCALLYGGKFEDIVLSLATTCVLLY